MTVLAVGREDGLVSLHSVEDGHLLHEFSAGAAITQLQWTQQSEDRYVYFQNFHQFCSLDVMIRIY